MSTVQRIYCICVLIFALQFCDIVNRTWIEYVPAYHIKNYIYEQKDQFNETFVKIISVVSTTEKTLDSLKRFFEGTFISSLCKTSTGKSLLGSLCMFEKRQINSEDYLDFFSSLNKTEIKMLMVAFLQQEEKNTNAKKSHNKDNKILTL